MARRGSAYIAIDLKVDADETIERMEDMREQAHDLRPVFRWAKRELEKSYAANIAASGLLAGGWDPLSPSYALWKAARFPGAPMMVRTGRLFRSISELNDSSINVITKTSAQFGTTVEYAKFHQYGTSKMPKRKIVFEPRGFASDLGEKIAKYVVDGSAILS